MNYGEMPAGREMDALVAERVMGWANIQLDAYVNYSPGRDACGDDPSGKGGWNQSGRKPVPSYSTNTFGAAWLVVERMLYCRYTWEAKGHGGRVEFHFLDNGQVQASANAETLPLAICRAALLAVGKE